MIYCAYYTVRFKKDYRRMIQRGKKIAKLDEVLVLLLEGKKLGEKYRDHLLIGNFRHRRECHIEPDWLLIYYREGSTIIFERTGTHADLFR